jgi:23S rRNA A2030 N6-methylase RlmJ
MLRRVLYDVLLDKGCKLQPIKEGVKELIQQQRLPAIFDEWLPAIKDDGHDGAHPDRALKVSTENVAETLEYTAELMRFLYIEPYEFQQRKSRNAPPPQP